MDPKKVTALVLSVAGFLVLSVVLIASGFGSLWWGILPGAAGVYLVALWVRDRWRWFKTGRDNRAELKAYREELKRL